MINRVIEVISFSYEHITNNDVIMHQLQQVTSTLVKKNCVRLIAQENLVSDKFL